MTGKKTFTGSCHCGHVRFEADIDLADGADKCDCTFCTKLRFRGAIVKPSEFRLLSGHAVLVDYRFDSESLHHPFCRYCGAHAFAHGSLAAVGGEFFSVNLECLDDADISEPDYGPRTARLSRSASAACFEPF